MAVSEVDLARRFAKHAEPVVLASRLWRSSLTPVDRQSGVRIGSQYEWWRPGTEAEKTAVARTANSDTGRRHQAARGTACGSRAMVNGDGLPRAPGLSKYSTMKPASLVGWSAPMVRAASVVTGTGPVASMTPPSQRIFVQRSSRGRCRMRPTCAVPPPMMCGRGRVRADHRDRDGRRVRVAGAHRRSSAAPSTRPAASRRGALLGPVNRRRHPVGRHPSTDRCVRTREQVLDMGVEGRSSTSPAADGVGERAPRGSLPGPGISRSSPRSANRRSSGPTSRS